MRPLRAGSVCTGYSGLDMAVLGVFGGELAWVADNEPGAAQILDHRHPGVKNLGDITKVDWATVEPVDILIAGFPCQDISSAGLRAGLQAGNRSGLWHVITEAIRILRPQLVLLENVRAILTARGDRPTDEHLRAEATLRAANQMLDHLALAGNIAHTKGDGRRVQAIQRRTDRVTRLRRRAVARCEHHERRLVRAVGTVLRALAGLGFNAEWDCVRAADIGAPHIRDRWFALAWRDAEDPNLEPGQQRGKPVRGETQGGGAWADAGRPGRAHPRLAAVPASAGDRAGDGRGRAADADSAAGGLDEPGTGRGTLPGPEVAERAPVEPGRRDRRGRGAGPVADRGGRGTADPADGGGPARVTEPASVGGGHDADGGDPGPGRRPGVVADPGGPPRPGARRGDVADPAGAGRERPGPAGPDGRPRLVVGAPADPGGRDPERRGGPGDVAGTAGRAAGEGVQQQRGGGAAGDRGPGTPADPADYEPERPDGVPSDDQGDARPGPGPRDRGRAGGRIPADAKRRVGDRRAGQPQRPPAGGTSAGWPSAADSGVQWGKFAPAIERWEFLTGRPAPAPTDMGRTGPRLSPRFVEWMMGLPPGWVTDVPGLSRAAMLKALGNGVVPQQAVAALYLLAERARDAMERAA